jgi:hypothetical protein
MQTHARRTSLLSPWLLFADAAICSCRSRRCGVPSHRECYRDGRCAYDSANITKIRVNRRSRGPSGKWCNKAAYCVRFRRAAPTHCGPQRHATLTAVAFEIFVPRRHVTVPPRMYSIPPCACMRHWSGAAAAGTRRAPARRRCRARANGGASLRWSMRTTCHACLRSWPPRA